MAVWDVGIKVVVRDVGMGCGYKGDGVGCGYNGGGVGCGYKGCQRGGQPTLSLGGTSTSQAMSGPHSLDSG